MINEKVGDKDYLTIFESIDELVRYLKAAPLNAKVFGSHPSSMKEGSSWNGTSSLDEAFKFLTDGWEEGYRQLLEQLKFKDLAPKVINRKFVERTDVIGYTPCVPRAIQGLPDSMFWGQVTPIKSKVIDIFVNVTCSASVEPDEILRRGMLVLNFINSVEKKGYRTNLYVMESAKCDGETTFHAVKIKKSTEPLSLKRIAFPIANPAMLRRIWFRTLESHTDCESGWAGGYGRVDDNIGKTYVQKHYPHAFVIPTLNEFHVSKDEDQNKWLEKVFAWNGFRVE